MVVKSHLFVPFVVKSFVDKVFKSHMRVHRKEEQFECSVSGKIFNNSSTRNNQMRTHIGEKPHECSVCDKKFGET